MDKVWSPRVPTASIARHASQRPLRLLAVAAVLGAICAALAALATAWDSAFCGIKQLQPRVSEPSGVAMKVRARKWTGGMPNHQEIQGRKMSYPSVSSMKDQYFILWARSPKVRNWYPVNIISGTDAAKNIKSATDNQIGKAIGADRFADYQIVRAIGLNLYKQEDEAKKQAIKMHPQLSYASSLEWGYKEIQNNTEFNKNPMPYLSLVNVSKIPPEEELRNVLDDAGDAVQGAGSEIGKVADSIKGFFSSR